MNQVRDDLIRYAESGVLNAKALAAAWRLAGATPDAGAWRRFIDRFLVISGALLVAVGVIYFIAFNWQSLGRMAKFGMLEALVLLPTVYALLTDLRHVRAQAALLFAVLILGGLLALVGQTYQTGADNYELFLAWALLALPWVLAGRWAPLWAVWWTLLNLSLALYLFEVLDPLRLLLFSHLRPTMVIVLNLAGLFGFEWAWARYDEMRGRWLARYCILLALAAATVNAVMFVMSSREGDGAGFALYCAMIAGGAWYYQNQRRDLFPLALGVLSLIVVVTAWLSWLLLRHSNGFSSLSLITLVIVGATVLATKWLRDLNRKWSAPVPVPEGQPA